jgi:hypothetical protein
MPPQVITGGIIRMIVLFMFEMVLFEMYLLKNHPSIMLILFSVRDSFSHKQIYLQNSPATLIN